MAKSIVSKSQKPANRAPLRAVNAAPAKSIDSLQGPELLRYLLRMNTKNARGHWGIPARGGYGGGCMAGSAAAVAYLKYLRVSPDARGYGGYLQNIAMGMLSKRSTDLHSGESLRGQAVGFFSTINDVLLQCVGMLDALDAHSFESIVGDIDQGLARTKADEKAPGSRASEVSWFVERRKRVAVSKEFVRVVCTP